MLYVFECVLHSYFNVCFARTKLLTFKDLASYNNLFVFLGHQNGWQFVFISE